MTDPIRVEDRCREARQAVEQVTGLRAEHLVAKFDTMVDACWVSEPAPGGLRCLVAADGSMFKAPIGLSDGQTAQRFAAGQRSQMTFGAETRARNRARYASPSWRADVDAARRRMVYVTGLPLEHLTAIPDPETGGCIVSEDVRGGYVLYIARDGSYVVVPSLCDREQVRRDFVEGKRETSRFPWWERILNRTRHWWQRG